MEYKKEAVKGFEKYQVDTNGIVYGQNGKPLKPSINHNGYQIVNFCINNVRTGHSVHTLVATQFLTKESKEQCQVNHKDGCKTNNCVDNLEWVTPSENMYHAARVLGSNVGERNGNARAIVAFDKNTLEKVYEYGSLMDAARDFVERKLTTSTNLKIVQSSIWRALNGKRDYYKNLIWKYKDEI